MPPGTGARVEEVCVARVLDLGDAAVPRPLTAP
jgi:hypothetical protein